MIWQLPRRCIAFPRRPLVMGIVNVNDDSFSGDGTLDFDEAARQAAARISAGADIVDIGAESAGTKRPAISIAEEIRRFRGFLARWDEVVKTSPPRDDQQLWPPVLSINTWRPEVVGAVLEDGRAELLNDMSGLPDVRNAEACASRGVSLLIMHLVGQPKVPHVNQRWDDVMVALERFFAEKLEMAAGAWLSRVSIILDPGIDFAKGRDDNLTILRELARLHHFGCPILVPLSRKRVIGDVLGLPDARDRDAGTVACIAAAIRAGAQILRVHNVEAAWQSVKVLDLLEPRTRK
jgi:dihydropteroate synthase